MFQHQGIWLPDGEKHFPEWMSRNGEIVDGKGTYQIKKLRAAMEHCKKFRNAVDVGAHVGLWSMQLIRRFEMVYAFEPVTAFRECWEKNLNVWQKLNAVVIDYALGKFPGTVEMAIDPADSGGTHVKSHIPEGPGIRMRTLDSFAFKDVDFVKIDCEGYEEPIVAGARETLLRCRPCVIVEQKPHKLGPNFGIKGTPAVDMLRELGAEVRREMGGDYIMSWA
jgi:FkbM family methyltransferase